MKKLTLLLSLFLAAAGLTTATAQETGDSPTADFPFALTTIVDGEFAENTQWYTMDIAASSLHLVDTGDAEYMELSGGVQEFTDAELWCFVGNATDGISIYNKQAGTGKRLASPKTMSGADGGTAYVVVKADGDDNYSYLWDFSTSDKLSGTTAYYLNQHGVSANKINNRNGKLAFWTTGADAGSSVVIRSQSGTFTVSLAHGTFTASNPNKTYHQTWSSNEMSGFTFGCAKNNMQSSENNIVILTGGSSCTYTITAPVGYNVTGFSFDAVNLNGGTFHQTITAGEQTITTTATPQHFEVSGLEERTAAFVQTGSNGQGVVLTNFTVHIERSKIVPEPYTGIFVCKGSEIPYRIPAIAKAGNGDLVAVADYRHSRADIGMANYGRIDLHARISKDNGQTWGDVFPIIEGQGKNSPDFMNVGFGDPCIAADSESGRMLVMSCAGNVSFPGGTRDNHQCMARFYSEDNGQTWSAPEDISESIYSQFDDSPFGPVRAMFIGSGKISQSKTTKIGDYYRLYCAVLVKDKNGSNINFVLYSDDFGGNWKVLGGTDVTPIPSGGDEPKADELPDGSVLISSRSTGRLYNIFTFTNTEKAEGSWGAATRSLASDNNGICNQGGNPVNGEIMIIPAVRKSDNQPVYIALQSVAFGPNRANVGIYYKELAGLSDFDTPENFAKDWDGRHQSSYLGSAYSTMAWQDDNKLAFIYEEDLYSCNGGYSIVYKNYSLEQITDSAYTYNTEGIDAQSFIQPGVSDKVANITAGNPGTFVGMYSAAGMANIDEALKAYEAAPSKNAYEALNTALFSADNKVTIEAGRLYRLRNYGRGGNMYLKAKDGGLTAGTLNTEDKDQLFAFMIDENGNWNILNEDRNAYISPTGATETQIPMTESKDEAGRYKVTSDTQGRSALLCQNPAAGVTAIHLAGDKTRLVPWYASSPAANDASFWYIEPTDMAVTGIGETETETVTKEVKLYDLTGRRVTTPAKGGIYVTSDRRKVFAK